MALLFIKRLLVPSDRHASYLPLATRSPTDHERSSLEIALPDTLNEKSSRPQNQSQTFRVNPRIISDATIGLSDGLTVPFALTAGLSALGDTSVVIYAGIAELIAGGISMGLGGYLGAKSEAEAYHSALTETSGLVETDYERAEVMVRSTFAAYEFAEQTLNSIVSSLLARPENMVDFLMRFHHQLTEADYAPSRAYLSGLTIALAYLIGGLVPLMPYVFLTNVHDAFFGSVLVMSIALFAFGWAKTSFVGDSSRWSCFKNGVQMTMLGGVAAGAAMGCVKAVGS